MTEVNTRKRVANKTYLHPKDGLKNSFECSVSHTACWNLIAVKLEFCETSAKPYTERSWRWEIQYFMREKWLGTMDSRLGRVELPKGVFENQMWAISLVTECGPGHLGEGLLKWQTNLHSRPEWAEEITLHIPLFVCPAPTNFSFSGAVSFSSCWQLRSHEALKYWFRCSLWRHSYRWNLYRQMINKIC